MQNERTRNDQVTTGKLNISRNRNHRRVMAEHIMRLDGVYSSRFGYFLKEHPQRRWPIFSPDLHWTQECWVKNMWNSLKNISYRRAPPMKPASSTVLSKSNAHINPWSNCAELLTCTVLKILRYTLLSTQWYSINHKLTKLSPEGC